jgi:adenylylsulfate kinase-like enzyme
MDLEITYIPTNKSEIKITALMEDNTIPLHPSSILFSGASGSGKTNLIANLLTKEQFYKDYFDIIFLFAGSGDNLFTQLGIKEENIYYDDFKENLERVSDIQKEIIEQHGFVASPKILIIFDDLISDKKFLNTKAVKTCFVKNRHSNISTWITTQSYTQVPRTCRLNCQSVFFFKGNKSERDLIAQEYCCGGREINDMYRIIREATKDKYNFLYINTFAPHESRFKRNLTEILN